MSRRPFNLQFLLHVISLFRASVWLMCRLVWSWSNQGYVVKVTCWPVVPTQRSRASFSSINWFPPTLSFSLGKQVKTQIRYKDRQKPIFSSSCHYRRRGPTWTQTFLELFWLLHMRHFCHLLCSFYRFEVGGARVEKGDLACFHAPIWIKKYLNLNLVRVVGLFAEISWVFKC